MEEGAMFFVIRFPKPWPPTKSGEMSRVPHEGGILHVHAHNDGRLAFSVTTHDSVMVEFETQRLAISGGGWAIMSVSWTSSGVSIRLNGQEINSLDNAAEEVRRVETTAFMSGQQLSFQDPHARKNCKPWMEWRKRYYANPKLHPKAGRRLKTETEQVLELEKAIRELSDLVTLVDSGNTHMLPSLRASLRALVYWQDKPKSNYNPLLLRMAGRLDLPLPVFTFSNKFDEAPQIIHEAKYHYLDPLPTLRKMNPKQELVDLQDWLSSTIQIERLQEAEQADESQTREMTIKELIVESASTLGLSHYDDDVALKVDRLHQTKAFEVDMITRVLMKTSEVILGLGRYVIDRIQKDDYPRQLQ